MAEKHGNLSIDSENIFPIIKKWLYSDQDIFLRELISNGCDAITKLKKLALVGECELPDDYEPQIHVIYNAEEKTLKVTDNGLGMDADEVEEYINQIAFSGATDFINKYQGKSEEDQIIGHFGLGFYSAFMVADEVWIDTLSWKKDAVPVHWECDGGTEFDMKDGDRDTVGTTITLHLNDDCLEFANEYRLREVIEKYCSFMPIPIFLEKENAEPEYELIDPDDKTDKDTVIETVVEEAKTEERENENGEKETVEISPKTEKLKILKRPVPLNDTQPLWTKNPSECTDDEYKEFYHKVFKDYRDPLFWIHLNMDYPFNLRGIIYFPKLNLQYEAAEGKIKLYNNQVFIADNIKEVIPEFLMVLKGVIDCPDLPLNVSRSALQNDGFATKIRDYITKKVADKLIGLCKTDKEQYEKFWDDIAPFIKYGCLKDAKFCDKMNDFILFKDIYDKYITLPELLASKEDQSESSSNQNDAAETSAEDQAESADTESDSDNEGSEEKETEIVYYVTDQEQQGQYIRMFKKNDMNAVIMDSEIDSAFISQLENRNQDYEFKRIDSDITDSMKAEPLSKEDAEKAQTTLEDAFKSALNNDKLAIHVEKLKDDSIPAVMTVSEEEHRMSDMFKYYSMNEFNPDQYVGPENLTVNLNNKLVQYILNHSDSENVPLFCQQIYDLAKIMNHPLNPTEMTSFVERSNKVMSMLAK